MLSRRTVQLPQGRVSYLEQGSSQPGAPSMVLLHGLMGTAATFLPFLEVLPATQHVIAVDLPGAGGSERNRQVSPSLHSISRCVGQILDELHVRQPLLIGHSHGGTVALHLAASQPGRVCGLVLLAPAHPFFRHADQLISFYLSPAGRVFAHTMPWYPRWVQMAGLRRMAGPQSLDTPDRLVPYRENLRIRGTVPFLLRLLRTWHTDMRELRALLEAPFRVPTLLIWGDHDRAVPVGTAADLRKRLRCSELHVLPGVGHRPAEESPKDCARLIEDWTGQLAMPRRREVSAAD